MKWVKYGILFQPITAHAGKDPTGSVNNFWFILFLVLIAVVIWWWEHED
ncbi:hypothetical protein SAMN02746062_02151 [Alysiella filiformis DSM 16848]|uniref:Uncharacterized protein n=1 Tax=Alysiella filiformis DSM 16848 TaxID=1120981 RepID=A0A286EL24_9NEIS|nr:hypothetical protein [Alysiella filiformis]SOD71539.1 hypothetical protein SAMN02746062_02151 [Alysiella filiformis DSM 16848]